ncbi:sugar O-acetyltransferase [Bacillus sp. V3-13]|uniref:sugar O-acetyltransferase n=1 Tax=Bacillus sp. V3-13 TaxID=2053728 RepID=UPI000C76545E|nr:sugar O-acetyltransferase [Bacillus sp. V3-13]PLR75570.1 sugar O-acetyltransferase [Bacillus sp. V3-13]
MKLEVYCDFEPELIKGRKEAKKITRLYNLTTDDDDEEQRNLLLDQLFQSRGKNTIIEPNFRVEFGFNINVGNNFFANYDAIILDCAKVTIGNDVLFGPRVKIYTANHVTEPKARAKGDVYALPVTIGNKVWLGANVIVNPGITIGENSIIGSGSVVTKDIPPNVIAVGTPCKVIKNI